MNRAWPEATLILAGHGSTINRDSSAPTRRLAEALAGSGRFAQVRTAFWKEEPSIAASLEKLQTPVVFIVPVFVGEGYFTKEILPAAFGITDDISVRGDTLFHYTRPVGCHPSMTRLVLDRARAAAPGVEGDDTALIIVGHGTEKNKNSRRAVDLQVAAISAMGIYGEVLPAFMEQEPSVTGWHEMTDKPRVVAAPLFISNGLHGYDDIPGMMGIATDLSELGSVFARNPHRVKGRQLWYAPAIGTGPELAEIVLDMVAESSSLSSAPALAA